MVTWHYLRSFPDTCDEETTRGGELAPCEKPAVAARRHEGDVYPVCAYHARGLGMVPLRELLEHGPEDVTPDGEYFRHVGDQHYRWEDQ